MTTGLQHYHSGKTGTIRIPLVFKERILAIARELDEGKEVSAYSKDEIHPKGEVSKAILSQDKLSEIIQILNTSITSKKRSCCKSVA